MEITHRQWKITGRAFNLCVESAQRSWAGSPTAPRHTCGMIESRKTGGRPKTKTNIKGCPSYISEHIRSIAGPRYRCSIPLTTISSSGVEISDLVCKLCDSILDEPVELQCKHLLCCSCCLQLLRSHLHSIPCPQCQYLHEIEKSSFQSPPPLITKLLQQLVVRCDRGKCTKAVPLCDLKSHLDNKCTLNSSVSLVL